MEQKTKKFIYINIWCDIVSFVTISQVWRCEVMAIHHHSDLPWSWLQNTKPYQLPPKNSIFWSSDFRKIPFLPLFLYIFYTKMAQMPQCHTYIYTWRNFYKKSKEQNGKTKKIFIHDIYGCDIVAFVTFKMSQIWNRKNFYIYIYIYI